MFVLTAQVEQGGVGGVIHHASLRQLLPFATPFVIDKHGVFSPGVQLSKSHECWRIPTAKTNRVFGINLLPESAAKAGLI
jgi:hypothetical protein